MAAIRLALVGALALGGCASPEPAAAPPLNPSTQTKEQAAAKSAGCLSCHVMPPSKPGPGLVDDPDMHVADARVGCVDCHGGDPAPSLPAGATNERPFGGAYLAAMEAAHVRPSYPSEWPTSANPERTFTLLNRENPEFVRFINPGDLRVAHLACGPCHPKETAYVPRSLMTTSAMFYSAATYNNGALPLKPSYFGESYSARSEPQRLQGVVEVEKNEKTVRPPTPEEIARGVRPSLDPLPRWNVAQAGNIFRAFERGGRVPRGNPSDVGVPRVNEDPGRPDMKLGDRGFGTQLRFDPTLLNPQKTRLNDPHLSFLGTNDHPGDYRSSGCTACHVVYANDRSAVHSGEYAKHGNLGRAGGGDPTIRKDESGHPIAHRFTNSIPSSQCMTCHHHQPNAFMNTFFGYQMWDYETDGAPFWPKEQKRPSEAEKAKMLASNPEGASVRGNWSDKEFLASSSELNAKAKHTQFADYHGHGWMFRAVYKRDRKGNLLDGEGAQVAFDDPERWTKAVHLMDIHAERGMHCVDCHFKQDNHGDGRLYGEYPNAIEITCADCHGTVRTRFAEEQKTSGPAATGKWKFTDLKTPWGEPRFEWRGDEMAPLQRSMMKSDKVWEIPQIQDIVTPSDRMRENGKPWYNERAAHAKTVRKDGTTWGKLPEDDANLAHRSSRMECYTCHTSWTTGCFGCHLPMKANERRPMLHNEGDTSRNWTSYNPQVVRDDIFMLGQFGSAKGGRVAPVRSSSALVISSQNANREWIYQTQPPVSAPGFSSQAFNPHFPHTVRGKESRGCADCHVSAAGDNNAWLAQVYLQGTNFVNFMGRYCWVAEGHEGFEGVEVAEIEEPQAVYGSELHKLAYPEDFEKHVAAGRVLAEAHHHDGKGARSLQARGEYLYAALGRGGFRAYDIANIHNKGFSERIVTAPVSPLGQDTHVSTRFATAVALPTTMPVHDRSGLMPEAFWKDNQEDKLHPLYRYAFVSDFEEGLVVVDVTPLADGEPRNNFLKRAATWNPAGALSQAVNITLAGARAYVSTRKGLAVVNLDDPLKPVLETVVGAPAVVDPRAVAIQFRYAFVADAEGLKVLDITNPGAPVLKASVPMRDVSDVYVARTWAYVAAGGRGLALIDVEKPEKPGAPKFFDAGGVMNDVRGVRVASTNATLFAYVADGRNGVRVLSLVSPETVPGHYGFSPDPNPVLIATYPTKGPAVALSKPLDRDRAVDETGNQVSVFGRFGSKPLDRELNRRMYLRDGKLWTVTNEPTKPAEK
ncbi:MAG TPA: multiheme c-type cytochrome [Planctomycetota bacterium]